MASGFWRGTGVHFDGDFSLLEWPSKRPGDIGFVYVGIVGKDFAEVVSVTVSDASGSGLIREIEWGRP